MITNRKIWGVSCLLISMLVTDLHACGWRRRCRPRRRYAPVSYRTTAVLPTDNCDGFLCQTKKFMPMLCPDPNMPDGCVNVFLVEDCDAHVISLALLDSNLPEVSGCDNIPCSDCVPLSRFKKQKTNTGEFPWIPDHLATAGVKTDLAQSGNPPANVQEVTYTHNSTAFKVRVFLHKVDASRWQGIGIPISGAATGASTHVAHPHAFVDHIKVQFTPDGEANPVTAKVSAIRPNDS